MLNLTSKQWVFIKENKGLIDNIIKDILYNMDLDSPDIIKINFLEIMDLLILHGLKGLIKAAVEYDKYEAINLIKDKDGLTIFNSFANPYIKEEVLKFIETQKNKNMKTNSSIANRYISRTKYSTEQLIELYFPSYTVNQVIGALKLIPDKKHQEIFEYAFGLNGKEITSNIDIATRFRVTPKNVTQILYNVRENITHILKNEINFNKKKYTRDMFTTEQLIKRNFPGYTVDQVIKAARIVLNDMELEIFEYAYGLNGKDITSDKDIAIKFDLDIKAKSILGSNKTKIISFLKNGKQKINKKIKESITPNGQISEPPLFDKEEYFCYLDYRISVSKLISLFKGYTNIEILRTIECLHSLYLVPFIIKYGYDKTDKEVAAILGDSVDNIQYRIDYAYLYMQEALINKPIVLNRNLK